MARFKLTIEYDGGPFVGWQRQDNGLGVQQVLEEAIRGFTNEVVTLHCAGRTDAGVHALGQVAHFDLLGEWEPHRIRDALNAHIRPHPISVIAAENVAAEFHARLSATERRYEYHILNRRSPPAIKRGCVWWVPSPLDTAGMSIAAEVLIGHHDFTSFRATNCQAKSPLKTLDELAVARMGETIVVTARARSFLHHQVRNMVGTLGWVGQGKWSATNVERALKARNRAAGGPTAPADGLFLVGVGY